MKSLICIIFIIVVTGLLYWNWTIQEDGDIFQDVTLDIEKVFKFLDTDQDGVLKLNEFLRLKKEYTILRKKVFDSSEVYETQDFPEFMIHLGEQIVNLDVNFTPLVLDSMKKNLSELTEEGARSLTGLLQWKKPFKTQHPFGASFFYPFLPEDSSRAIAGYSWWIAESKCTKDSEPLPSGRYLPPRLRKRELLSIHALLNLFHAQPFLWTRFCPQGTAAVVRAVSEDFYDIVFRIHAEFQLNKPPLFPFWFTPSQFSGRIIINKDGNVVKFFQMEVPDTKVNVDMEWLNDPTEESMEVDIGYIPEMSLISSAISVPSNDKKGAYLELSEIKWTEQITIEEAGNMLESKFFAFKKIKYHKMLDAFEVAGAESKLVHGILLWGNLADQSC